MYPWLIEERANQHRRDLLRQAERAALVRSARQANRRPRRPRGATSSPRRRLGVLLIRIGGRLVAQRQPDAAPCPWCDLAFPQPGPSPSVPSASVPPLVGVRD